MPLAQPPKVSVMIPTYNQKSYIKDIFASALMQDYPNLEIIVSFRIIPMAQENGQNLLS